MGTTKHYGPIKHHIWQQGHSLSMRYNRSWLHSEPALSNAPAKITTPGGTTYIALAADQPVCRLAPRSLQAITDQCLDCNGPVRRLPLRFREGPGAPWQHINGQLSGWPMHPTESDFEPGACARCARRNAA